MLSIEDFKKILPNVDMVDEGVVIYRQFYTEEKEKEFGIVGIEVGLV